MRIQKVRYTEKIFENAGKSNKRILLTQHLEPASMQLTKKLVNQLIIKRIGSHHNSRTYHQPVVLSLFSSAGRRLLSQNCG